MHLKLRKEKGERRKEKGERRNEKRVERNLQPIFMTSETTDIEAEFGKVWLTMLYFVLLHIHESFTLSNY